MSNDDVLIEEKNGEEFEFEQSAEEAAVNPEVVKEMMEAGLWYGRKKNRTHPRMKQFIFTTRNGIEIIDLAKTLVALDAAINFLKEKAAKGEQILFVATQPAAKKKLEEIAKKLNYPFVTNRWLGGTLTNFATISKRVDHFKKLKADQASGEFEKYTKKERLNFGKEIERLKTFFSGVETMNKLPGAVFVVNAKIHSTAVREANKMKIPVVAIISTDIDPDFVAYPIPANDSSPKSIEWILSRLEKALAEVVVLKQAVSSEKPSQA